MLWYLSDSGWPAPNLDLLNNALQQIGWKDKSLTQNNWRMEIRKRLENVEWPGVANDVHPFLERGGDQNLLT